MGYTVRMCVLGVILVIALCALGWEFGVAVPAFNNAQKKLEKISDENIKRDSKNPMTLADVKEVIKKEPETEFDSPGKKTGENAMRAMMFIRKDKYSYYHVMPWKDPETIHVVYKRRMQSEEEVDMDPAEFEDTEWVFMTVHFNQEPTVSKRHVPSDMKNPGDMPAAAGGGGGPRQRPDPEAIMKQSDKNGDGKLSGDEITGRMKQFAERMDTDKDGAITLEEMKAAMSQPRGGAGGGGKKGGKGARPKFDEAKKSAGEKSEAKKSDENKSTEVEKGAGKKSSDN